MLSDVEKNQLLTEKKVYRNRMQNQTNVQKNKSCLGCQSAADLTAEQMNKRKALRNKMSNKLSQRNKKKKVQDELSKASAHAHLFCEQHFRGLDGYR